jgi:hypothetical protein
MKKAYLLLAIVLLLAVVVVAAVDFSGTWALNADKTAAANPAPPAGGGGGGGGGGRGGGGMGGGDMTIKQAGNVLTITRTMGGNPVDTAYTMDGADHTLTSQQGDTKYKAVLSANSVHITGTATSQRGDRPVDTTYALSDDGKTLTVTNVNQGQNGPTTRKQIYDKK